MEGKRGENRLRREKEAGESLRKVSAGEKRNVTKGSRIRGLTFVGVRKRKEKGRKGCSERGGQKKLAWTQK